MENNNNLNKNEEKTAVIKALKVAFFAGLGFWAAGPIGAVLGLVIACVKMDK